MQASNDVGEAIAYYSIHNRISQAVLEASIFRSPYFVGRFLRSLLSPSPSIDSDRENFIAALTKYSWTLYDMATSCTVTAFPGKRRFHRVC